MAHAEKCPVCGGTGKAAPAGAWAGSPDSFPTCHGCQGKGWVTVEDSPKVCPTSPPVPVWVPPTQYYGPTYLPYPYRTSVGGQCGGGSINEGQAGGS